MDKEFDSEICNVKHYMINKINTILFTLILFVFGTIGYSVTVSNNAIVLANEVQTELKIWQSGRIEAQKNTDMILIQLRDEIKDLNINFKKHLEK